MELGCKEAVLHIHPDDDSCPVAILHYAPLKMKGAWVKDNEIINPKVCKLSLLYIFSSAALKQGGCRLTPWIQAEGVLLSERRRLEGTEEARA